jgi:hypothetical protein
MSDNWYYTENGQQHGPFSVEQMAQLAASGKLQPAALVWKQGMGDWKPANAVSELESLRKKYWQPEMSFSDTRATNAAGGSSRVGRNMRLRSYEDNAARFYVLRIVAAVFLIGGIISTAIGVLMVIGGTSIGGREGGIVGLLYALGPLIGGLVSLSYASIIHWMIQMEEHSRAMA